MAIDLPVTMSAPAPTHARKRRRLSPAISLSVSLSLTTAGAAHGAAPSPNADAVVENFLPMNRTSALEIRVAQLQGYLAQIARPVPPNVRINNMGNFCGAFTFYDAASLPRPTWLTLTEIPRDRSVETFARLALDCQQDFVHDNGDQGENGAFRAAWALDFLYFNRLADTTGHSVADVLAFRDGLNELYVATVLLRELGRSDAVRAGVYVEHAPDFLDAKGLSRADVLRRFAGLLSAFSPQEQPVLDDFIQLLDLRQDYLAPFGRATLNMMDSPDDLRVLSAFFAYENHLRLHPELLAEPHGGWHRLMKITGNDARQAVRVLGLLASVHLIVFRDLVPALGQRGLLTPTVARAFYEASLSYFLVNELDERAAKNGPNDHSLVYHFFFPDHYETGNWKWYHWYNNAYSGCELRRKGYPKAAIVGAIGSIGLLYEGMELNMAIPWRETMKLDPRVNPIVEGFDDVRINQDGAAYGAEICH